MPPLTSRKIKHPASTAAAPAFLEIFDWQPAHLRPAVVLASGFGAQGQALGEAMRSFVLVRAWDLQISASSRGAADRWCWWDDFVAALCGSAAPSNAAPAELAITKARLAQLEGAIAQFVQATASLPVSP